MNPHLLKGNTSNNNNNKKNLITLNTAACWLSFATLLFNSSISQGCLAENTNDGTEFSVKPRVNLLSLEIYSELKTEILAVKTHQVQNIRSSKKACLC